MNATGEKTKQESKQTASKQKCERHTHPLALGVFRWRRRGAGFAPASSSLQTNKKINAEKTKQESKRTNRIQTKVWTTNKQKTNKPAVRAVAVQFATVYEWRVRALEFPMMTMVIPTLFHFRLHLQKISKQKISKRIIIMVNNYNSKQQTNLFDDLTLVVGQRGGLQSFEDWPNNFYEFGSIYCFTSNSVAIHFVRFTWREIPRVHLCHECLGKLWTHFF